MVIFRSGLGCRIVKASASKFGHHFGGKRAYIGSKPRPEYGGIHLVFRFNLEDPVVPIQIEGVKWLPLFFAFQYDASRIGYRVVSDSEIEILSMDRTTFTPDFPLAGYPSVFPEIPVEAVAITYEEQRALCMADYITRREIQYPREGASQRDEEIIHRIGTRFTRLGTDIDVLLGKTQSACPNQMCDRSSWSGGMYTFALAWNEPIEGFDLWQSGGEIIQMVFQICQKCGSIQAFNELS